MSSLEAKRNIKPQNKTKKKRNENKTQKQKGHDTKNKGTTCIYKREKEK